MQKLFAKSWDTQDTLFLNTLVVKNCHFFRDTKSGHGHAALSRDPDGYLWFPTEGTHIPLSSYLGVPGASVCPPHRGR